MIEHYVDAAIASLLAQIPGLSVVVGMEDNDPPLKTPYCVVYSAVESAQGRHAIYELLTRIEYESISGLDTVTAGDQILTAIDRALTIEPEPDVLAMVTTTGLSYLAWESIGKTLQDVGDRRRNVREIKVFAGLA